MSDHTTTYPVMPAPGELWINQVSGNLLFIFKSGGALRGITSEGQTESDESLTKIEEGKGGWKRAFPLVEAGE